MRLDLTESRCRSELALFLPRVLGYYDKAFPDASPDEPFWRRVDELDDELGRAFAVRPLTPPAIKQALEQFGTAFKAAVIEARQRAPGTSDPARRT